MNPDGAPGVSAERSATLSPATSAASYASGDLIANAASADAVTPFAFTVPDNGSALRIERVRLKKNLTQTANASYRVHFFTASPTVSNGDNGVLAAPKASWVGCADITANISLSDGVVGTGVSPDAAPILTDASATLYALLEARGAYSASAVETYQLTIEGYRL